MECSLIFLESNNLTHILYCALFSQLHFLRGAGALPAEDVSLPPLRHGRQARDAFHADIGRRAVREGHQLAAKDLEDVSVVIFLQVLSES